VNVKQLQKGIKEVFSDIRLKRDIRPVATLQNGLQLYSYRYIWDDVYHIGVMAQDLLKQADFRHAVRLTGDGFYVVNYEKLGLKGTTPLKAWQNDMMEAVLLPQ